MRATLLLPLCLAVYIAAASSAIAQEQEEAETTFAQPIQAFPHTEAVYLQEQHEIQTTLSFFHDTNEGYRGNSLNYEVEYGITDWLQVSTELIHNHQYSKHSSYGVYQLEVGTMLSLLNTPRQAVSLELEVELPVKKPEEPEEAEGTEVAYTPVLLYARQLGNVQLHLYAGAELQAHEHAWLYNAAAVYGSGHWHPLMELNGTYEEDADWYLGPGLVFNDDSGWEAVAGIHGSLSHHDWDFAVKLLYEFTPGKH